MLVAVIKEKSVFQYHGPGAALLMRKMCLVDQFPFQALHLSDRRSVYSNAQTADIEKRNVFLVKPIYSGITEGLFSPPGAPSFSLSVVFSVLKSVSGPSLSTAASICSGVCCH